MTEKQLLAVAFAFKKFRPYLIGSLVIVFIDYAVLKHVLSKRDSKPGFVR